MQFHLLLTRQGFEVEKITVDTAEEARSIVNTKMVNGYNWGLDSKKYGCFGSTKYMEASKQLLTHDEYEGLLEILRMT